MLVEVTWHGKFRGPDFAPFSFKLIPAQSSKLVDSKGRLVWSIYAQAVSNAEQEALERVGRADEDKVLRVMLDHPDYTLSEIAEHPHWLTQRKEPSRQKASRVMTKLLKCKPPLVKQGRARGHYELTPRGREEAKKTPELADDCSGAA